MCGLYTREINLNPYFLYSQQKQLVTILPINIMLTPRATKQNYFRLSALYFTLGQKGSSYLSSVKETQFFC